MRPSIEELASSFDRKGFPLFLEKKTETALSVEETIINAFMLLEPRLHEGIPVLLTKNEIDYRKLKKLIDKHRLYNQFEYFGEFALKYLNEPCLRELMEYCHSRLQQPVNISGMADSYFKNLQNKEQKRWKVLGAPSYDSLEKQ